MSAAAGVPEDHVTVGQISEGDVRGVVVSSMVQFPDSELAESEAFAAMLLTDPSGVFVFASKLLSCFGPIESVVFVPPPPPSPPSPPPPHPPSPPPLPPLPPGVTLSPTTPAPTTFSPTSSRGGASPLSRPVRRTVKKVGVVLAG